MEVPSGSTFEILVKVAEIIVVPLLWKVYSVLSSLTSEVQTLKIILVGSDGKNGIRSRVRRLEKGQGDLALMFAAETGKTNLTSHEEQEESE